MEQTYTKRTSASTIDKTQDRAAVQCLIYILEHIPKPIKPSHCVVCGVAGRADRAVGSTTVQAADRLG